MIPIDRKGYFVTGSDTGVGKTYITCQLVRQLTALHQPVTVRKPVESGCHMDAQGHLIAADALLLSEANQQQQTMEIIAPWRFQAALAPDRAARLAGTRLYLQDLVTACEPIQADHQLLVEGAGGFYSPLAEDALNADLACALQLPVLIVVNDRIGAVNQALMTITAIENRHLSIAAIVLNQINPNHEIGMDNHCDLTRYCDYPVFQCHYQQCLPPLFQTD